MQTDSAAPGYGLYGMGNSIRRLRAFLASIAATRKGAKVPVLVHIHQASAGLAYHIASARLKNWRAVTVYTVHNDFRTYRTKIKVLSLINALFADRIAFVSAAAHDAYPAFMKRLAANRIITIPNGVNLDRVDELLTTLDTESERLSGVPQAGLRLVNVGRLVKQKNQQFLLHLMTQLDESVTLTIIGQGGLHDELLRLAEELGVMRRVRFTGLIPREQVYRELRNADVFVSPSLWEGLPIAVLEAMAVALPVVISKIAPHTEIEAGATSVLVRDLAVADWQACIGELLRLPAHRRKQIGADNRRSVEEEFSLAGMHRQYDAVYEQLESRNIPGGALGDDSSISFLRASEL